MPDKNDYGKIVIIDYGLGNLRSVLKRFNEVSDNVLISSDLNEIKSADKLVLPGVGHFAQGMINLKERGMIEVLNQRVLKDKVPILGICLGMQLFTLSSEEGNVDGLGWLDATTKRFDFSNEHTELKIPHIGWNSLGPSSSNVLCKDLDQSELYYFVHSYYVEAHDTSIVETKTTYGITFDSALRKDNIFGAQFHPEKSHDSGLRMLENFLRYDLVTV